MSEAKPILPGGGLSYFYIFRSTERCSLPGRVREEDVTVLQETENGEVTAEYRASWLAVSTLA